MKNSILMFLFCTIISCNTKITKSNTLKSKNYTNCRIYKIDSIGSYYLVYAIDNNFRYKIVSRKDYNKSFKKVTVNSKYKFELEEIINLDSISRKHVNYLDFKRCGKFYPSIEICNEPSIELYKTKNLIGLYYDENK